MKRLAILLTFFVFLAVSCEKEEPPRKPEDGSYWKVMIYYGCGQNNLDNNMLKNLQDLVESEDSYVPGTEDGNAIVVIHHTLPESGTYATSGPTNVTWIYRNGNGELVRDTVARYQFTTTADADAMKELLGFVKEKFKSEHYGIVFSSHGTGWMPQGSYDTEDTSEEIIWDAAPQELTPLCSFGQERVKYKDYFLDIPDMAKAFPMKMDYIIFDSCLMGGIEVAYELRNVTPRIGFSQAEVMSGGFYYPTMSRHLLIEDNPMAVMQDTYNYYKDRTSTSVVSYVDCTMLEPLAEACRTLCRDYRSQIDSVDPDKVQAFFRNGHHWFYDLEDIFVQSGISDEDLIPLRYALGNCVLYAVHTNKIVSTVTVLTNCGFSMFLPCNGSDNLKTFYKTLAWNEATGLVE